MKRWIKLLVTMVLAVSIPLQGLAAVVMPTCNMSNDSMNMNMNIVTTSVHSDISIDKSVIKSSSCDINVKNCCDTSGNKTCSDQKCSICHLSVFQLPDTDLLVMADSSSNVYQNLMSEPYQTFPPALYHPPKQLSI